MSQRSSSSTSTPQTMTQIKNMFLNVDIPLLFQSMKCDVDVAPTYEASKHRLKYAAVYEVPEIEKAFHKFLDSEFNTMPLDFIRDYNKFEEKKTNAQKAKHLDYILKTYINVGTDKELNLSGKDRKAFLEKVESCGQLNNTEDWVSELVPKDLLFPIYERARADLKDDSFGRFIISDIWKNLIPKYIKNPDVMERLKIFDAEQKNQRFQFEKPNMDKLATVKRQSMALSENSEQLLRKLSLNDFGLVKKLSDEEEQFLKMDKKLGGQYLTQGIQHFKKRENQQAYECYTFAIELDSTLREAYFNRGVLNYNTRNLVEAIEDMMKVVEMKPDHARALSVRAMSFKELGHYKAALRDFFEAERYEIIPKNLLLTAICFDQLDIDKKANEYYERYLEYDQNSRDAIMALHNKAQNYFLKNNFNQAIYDLTYALNLCEEDEDENESLIKEIKFIRSKCYKAIGDEEKAQLDYEQSTIVSADIVYDEAIKKFTEKDYLEAYKLFTKVLKVETKNEEVYYSRGLCAKYLGDMQRAADDFKKTIELNPKFPKSYIHLAKYYAKENDVENAKKHFKLCVEYAPTADNYFSMGLFHNSIEDISKAVNDFTLCLGVDPTYADAYYNRGLIKLRWKNFEGGLKDLNSALEYDNDPDIYVDRAFNNGTKNCTKNESQS
eukprot:gene4731-8314_t